MCLIFSGSKRNCSYHFGHTVPIYCLIIMTKDARLSTISIRLVSIFVWGPKLITGIQEVLRVQIVLILCGHE